MAGSRLWRQEDILPSEAVEKAEVGIIGVGGIGSPLATTLARMGIGNLTVWDPDIVELHNLSTQAYRTSNVGRAKVEALIEGLAEFGRGKYQGHKKEWDGTTKRILVSGVDSMAARKAIWEKIRYNPKVELYIDGRMGAEVGRIFSLSPIDPEKVAAYEATLIPDERALEEPCTRRAIGYTVQVLSGLMARQVGKFLTGEPLPYQVVIDLVTLTICQIKP